jgi:hypothetical protein
MCMITQAVIIFYIVFKLYYLTEWRTITQRSRRKPDALFHILPTTFLLSHKRSLFFLFMGGYCRVPPSTCRYMLPHNQRPLKLASLEFIDPSHPSSTITMCMITQAVIIFYIVFKIHPLTEWWTITERSRRKPNALFTSFFQPSCSLTKAACFSLSWVDIVYMNVDHEG